MAKVTLKSGLELMRYIVFVLSLLLSTVSFSVIEASSSPAPALNPNISSCKKIARVIESKDKSFYPGQQICRGQIIPESSQVTIGCIHVNNRFLVKSMIQLKECETDLVFPSSSSDENRARGDNNKFVLLSPRGRYLIQKNLPIFSWLPMNGAKKYIVKIVGNNVARSEYETKDNSLSISLPNNISRITIIVQAYSDIRRLSSEIYTFEVLPENVRSDVDGYLNKIDKFPVTEKDKSKLKLSVLGEYNLINDSLSLLKTQTRLDPQDSEAYLSLGDIQVIAGLFNEAKFSYQRSKLIAASKRDQVAEKLAESRLKLIQDNSFNILKKF
jgi:hypothetical protein